MRKWIVAFLPLIAASVLAFACEGEDVPAPAPAPVDSVAPAVVPVDTADVIPVDPAPEPEPEEIDPGFCQPGTACDWAGDPRLSRLTDPVQSSFRMIPDNKLFQPGDKVRFEVCARDEFKNPVVGIPGTVFVRARHERIAGDGTTLTGPDGCVNLIYTVQNVDMIGDPNNGEPDSGSYILDAYTGGRRVREVKVLFDLF